MAVLRDEMTFKANNLVETCTFLGDMPEAIRDPYAIAFPKKYDKYCLIDLLGHSTIWLL